MNKKTNEKTWIIKEILPSDKNIRFFNGNRDVDLKRVNHLKASMVAHGVLSAITVMKKNKNYFIVDGQHRYTAATELEYTIPAIVIKEIGMDAVKDMNTIQKSWSLSNFADFYTEMGNDEVKAHYEEINTVQKNTGLNDSALLHIYGGGITQFKKGVFVIKERDFAREMLENILDLKPFLPYAEFARFIEGYGRIVKHHSYDHQRLLHKLSLEHRIDLGKKANPSGYGRMIQDIFNYKARQEDLVMFSNW